MANINLLPWRERRREERKKAFFITLGAAFGLAAAVLGAGILYINSEIANQAARNAYITDQIAVLDTKIAEIRDLQQQKRALTERMAVIQDLQGRRPVIVRLFDELVRTLPDGVYYNSITRTGDAIALSGVADSANRVSTLMRYLDDSEWFADSNLNQITPLNSGPGDVGADGQQTQNGSFQLSVRVTTAGDDAEAEAEQ
jgi:type IV pilus assembly protein PilN